MVPRLVVVVLCERPERMLGVRVRVCVKRARVSANDGAPLKDWLVPPSPLPAAAAAPRLAVAGCCRGWGVAAAGVACVCGCVGVWLRWWRVVAGGVW